jgi:glutamate synthase (NADPH) small chain
VQRRVELLMAEGVQFELGAEVGRDIPATRVRAEHDAVVLCGGATRPRELPVPGRELRGVHFAMELLQSNTQHLLRDPAMTTRPPIDCRDKHVVVIGGGDTGTDCVGTAMRHGCRSLKQLEIMNRPPDERAADNPWPEWPRVYRMDYGQEEAAARFGEDPRAYAVTTKRFLGDSEGRVRAMELADVDWVKDAKTGRVAPRERPGSARELEVDLVFLAMGFLGPDAGPEHPVLEQLGVARDERSNARAEEGRYRTNVDGVFAAGDMRRGQSLVVWAIHEGRGAAKACDAFLTRPEAAATAAE